MAEPKAEEIIYLSTQVSAALLENAAMPEHEEALIRAIRRWLPDADAVDNHMIKGIAATVRENMMVHRALLLDRVDRLVAQGRAKAL